MLTVLVHIDEEPVIRSASVRSDRVNPYANVVSSLASYNPNPDLAGADAGSEFDF